MNIESKGKYRRENLKITRAHCNHNPVAKGIYKILNRSIYNNNNHVFNTVIVVLYRYLLFHIWNCWDHTAVITVIRGYIIQN